MAIRYPHLELLNTKHSPIRTLEVLYWQGVENKSRWNNFAKELLEYIDQFFPYQRVGNNNVSFYNINALDPYYPFNTKRIYQLRPHKRSKHPLIVINYDEEIDLVDSNHRFEYWLDRIDAEWHRHYKDVRTWRRHHYIDDSEKEGKVVGKIIDHIKEKKAA